MRTRITVETTDAQRYVIGAAATGEPHKASREEVIDYFGKYIDRGKFRLDDVAEAQRKAVLEGLGLPAEEPLADDE